MEAYLRLFRLLFICIIFAGGISVNAQATGRVYTVDDVGDTVDASAGDTICADANGRCTLRAAIDESNTTLARDAIVFNLPQPSVIELTLGQLSITKSLEIVGPGGRRLTIQRSLAAGTADFRVFHLASGLIVNFRNITIRNGIGSSGGAMFVDTGTIAGLFDSALIGNRGTEGGALSVRQAHLTILRSLVSSNLAENRGGGIYVADANSNVTIINSTFTGNSAATGGAIDNEGALILVNDTISQNAASASGSSIHTTKSGSVKVLNTIIGRDTGQASKALKGPFTSLGSNIVTDARDSTGFTNGANGDQVSDNNAIDPMLGGLTDNGGQTDTLAVLSGSPAIDRANPCVVSGSCPQLTGVLIRGAKDQRRYPRSTLFGNQLEIGAFEQSDPPFATQLASVNMAFFSPQTPIARFANSLVILTNGRTLERRYAMLNSLGRVRFSGVRIDDDYVLEVRAKRDGILTPLVFSFD